MSNAIEWKRLLKLARTECIYCGTKERLQLHHRNHKTKKFGFSNYPYYEVGAIARLKREIAKCDPVCAVCHTLIHGLSYWKCGQATCAQPRKQRGKPISAQPVI